MNLDWQIKTARLRLGKLQLSDAFFIQLLFNDPDCIRFIGDKQIHSIADAESYLKQGPLAMYAESGMGLLRVSLKKGDQAVGVCGLLKRDYLDLPDIGFAFTPEFRARGYGFEAAEAVITYARQQRIIDQVCAIVSPDNQHSILLLQKLGLTYQRDLNPTESSGPSQLFVGASLLLR